MRNLRGRQFPMQIHVGLRGIEVGAQSTRAMQRTQVKYILRHSDPCVEVIKGTNLCRDGKVRNTRGKVESLGGQVACEIRLADRPLDQWQKQGMRIGQVGAGHMRGRICKLDRGIPIRRSGHCDGLAQAEAHDLLRDTVPPRNTKHREDAGRGFSSG